MESDPGESIMHTTMHDHGDGTFHTEHEDGTKTEHPSLGHALMHMAAKHAPGDKHMHMHHDGVNITSHHADEDGEVHGPDEHADGDEAAEHARGVMDGDEDGEVPRHGDDDGYDDDLEYGV